MPTPNILNYDAAGTSTWSTQYINVVSTDPRTAVPEKPKKQLKKRTFKIRRFSMKGRTSRCRRCGVEAPTTRNLALLEVHPGHKYDAHYCGCGWSTTQPSRLRKRYRR